MCEKRAPKLREMDNSLASLAFFCTNFRALGNSPNPEKIPIFEHQIAERLLFTTKGAKRRQNPQIPKNAPFWGEKEKKSPFDGENQAPMVIFSLFLPVLCPSSAIAPSCPSYPALELFYGTECQFLNM